MTPIDHTQILRKLTREGLAIVLIFGVGTAVWATQTQISGAVVAPGQLVLHNNDRKVQHPTGGVVGELNVRDGDIVKAGQILIKLDETIIRATLQGITKKIDELEARAARLNAERNGYSVLAFPERLELRKSETDVAEIVETERSLYEARKAAHILRKQRLAERVQQLEQEAESLRADLDSKIKLASITDFEIKGLRTLDRQKLVTTQRMNNIERDAVNLTGQQSQLLASIAQTKGKIVETQMQSSSLDDELRADTTKELREAQAELAQQQEKKSAALDQLQRVDIRAPISGRVNELRVHAVGAVVTTAEPIMQIVPSEEQLELEVHVQPHDIDLLHVGQVASVRLNAFNRRTTPQIDAEVTRIAANVMKDEQTGALYYLARLTLGDHSLAEIKDLKLQAGMQAEALIKTVDRTPLEYLIKPLHDQMSRAMRER